MILKYIINEKDNNNLLKHILKKRLYISTNLLSKLKNNKCIFVNNESRHVNYIVNVGDIVEIYLDNANKTKDTTVVPSKAQNLDILYEDEYILAINKPAGIDIHPSMGNFDSTLANQIKRYYIDKNYNINKIHIITRLDKNTSGVCIIAKNEYIQELFLRKKDVVNFKKEYLAIASKIIEKDHFYIEKNIERKTGSIILRQTSDTSGEYAKTEVTVLNRNYENDYTKCKILLHTGRTHQIRVHLASIGHVLLGDDLYSNEYNKNYDILKYINRQALHALNISFTHPITNDNINLHAPIPEDILKIPKT